MGTTEHCGRRFVGGAHVVATQLGGNFVVRTTGLVCHSFGKDCLSQKVDF